MLMPADIQSSYLRSSSVCVSVSRVCRSWSTSYLLCVQLRAGSAEPRPVALGVGVCVWRRGGRPAGCWHSGGAPLRPAGGLHRGWHVGPPATRQGRTPGEGESGHQHRRWASNHLDLARSGFCPRNGVFSLVLKQWTWCEARACCSFVKFLIFTVMLGSCQVIILMHFVLRAYFWREPQYKNDTYIGGKMSSASRTDQRKSYRPWSILNSPRPTDRQDIECCWQYCLGCLAVSVIRTCLQWKLGPLGKPLGFLVL